MNSKIIMIVAIVVVAVGAVLFFFVLGGDETEPPEIRVEYTPGEFFTTNISAVVAADGTRTPSLRILKAAPVLVHNNDTLAFDNFLRLNNATIRDTIIFILRDLTENDIRAPGRQEHLREAIITALNERLGIDNFVDVLFNDFVMA